MAKDIFDRSYFSPVKEKEINEVVNEKKTKSNQDDDNDFILNDFVDDKSNKTVKNKKRLKSNFKLKKEEKKSKIQYLKVFKNSRVIFILMILLLAVFNSSMIFNDFKAESNKISNELQLNNDGKYFFGMVEVTNTSIDTQTSYFEFIKYYFYNEPILKIEYNDNISFDNFLNKYLFLNYIGFVIINFLLYLIGFKVLEVFLTGIFILYSLIATKREFNNFKLIYVVLKRSIFMLFPSLFVLLLIPLSYLGFLFYILFVIIHALVVIERRVLK